MFRRNNKDKPWRPHTSKHRWVSGNLCSPAWVLLFYCYRINASCSVNQRSRDTTRCHPVTKAKISYDNKIAMKETRQYTRQKAENKTVSVLKKLKKCFETFVQDKKVADGMGCEWKDTHTEVSPYTSSYLEHVLAWIDPPSA